MEIQKSNGVTVIVTDERLDAVVAPLLKEEVKKLAEQSRIKLIIDLTKTRFIDSSGCGALVASLRALLNNNGDMKIANPSPQARTLFQLTRLDRVFEIFDDVEAAQRSFS
ncbi:MAG: STAS domain-containing protein [Deltaproteobacteria bacterium]|nr:STAS domain-containing protein [Deltaproteobacteria bacterium]